MSWRAKSIEKKRLRKLYNQTWHSYGAGAFYSDKRGMLCRSYDYSHSHPNKKKWLRRHSNRKLRRGELKYWDEDILVLQRNGHKKQFDLWWELW